MVGVGFVGELEAHGFEERGELDLFREVCSGEEVPLDFEFVPCFLKRVYDVDSEKFLDLLVRLHVHLLEVEPLSGVRGGLPFDKGVDGLLEVD